MGNSGLRNDLSLLAKVTLLAQVLLEHDSLKQDETTGNLVFATCLFLISDIRPLLCYLLTGLPHSTGEEPSSLKIKVAKNKCTWVSISFSSFN